MKIESTPLMDCLVIHPKVHGDHRGWFVETYNQKIYQENGINCHFIQDNHSFSADVYTLRGLHFQKGMAAQSKLVRCTKGRIYDVVVDLRVGSPSYLKWFGIELDEHQQNQIFVPKGFAHGFLTLVPNTEVQYKVDHLYNKELDGGLAYNDPDLNINWELYLGHNVAILSEKDKNNPKLNDVKDLFKYHAK